MERSEQATVLLLTPFTKYTFFLGAKIKKKKKSPGNTKVLICSQYDAAIHFTNVMSSMKLYVEYTLKKKNPHLVAFIGYKFCVMCLLLYSQ